LLVVVLIIGILAAVALPQFEMAVEKSRATQAIAVVKALSESVERYYMENGTYPFDDDGTQHLLSTLNPVLDIEMTSPKGWKIYLYGNLYVAAARQNSSRFDYMISKTMENSSYKRGLTCNTDVNNDTSRSAQLCKQICHTNTLTKVWGSASSGCEFK